MQTQIRTLFLVAVLVSDCATLSSAEDSVQHALYNSLVTPSVEIKAAVTMELTFADGKTRQYAHQLAFQRDDETTYASEVTEVDGGSLRMDCLHRNNQLVRFQLDIRKGGEKHFLKAPVDPKSAGKLDLPQPKAGDVFNMGNFPVAGYIDGYDMGDYFPASTSGATGIDEAVTHISAKTEFGQSEAWVDAAHGFLPQRITIVKKPEHFTSGSRRVGGVLFDNKDPGSVLTEIRVELTDVVYDKDLEGCYYIKECVLNREKFSKRGFEMKERTTWKVNKFTYRPAFGNGIRPDVPIADGDAVTLEGASQLAYVWSEGERWVVPAQLELAVPSFGPSAEWVLDAALAKAKLQDKRVLACVGYWSCGPCRTLARFLKRQSRLFEDDYVIAIIDSAEPDTGAAVEKRLRKGPGTSHPWMVILDADGRELITSDGPDGNMGYPNTPKRIDYFLTMLDKTKKRLSAPQIGAIRQAMEGLRD